MLRKKPGGEAFQDLLKYPWRSKMKNFPIEIDFQALKHGVVTPV